MTAAALRDDYAAVLEVLQRYLDGLYFSDTQRLRQVFHPRAVYATAAGDTPLILDMAQYFPIVDARPAPAAREQARDDAVLAIEFAGPQTAFARVRCAIAPRRFIDLLTLIHVDGRWQVIAKVFHFDTAPEPTP